MDWKANTTIILMIIIAMVVLSTVKICETHILNKNETKYATVITDEAEVIPAAPEELKLPNYKINLMPEIQEYIWSRCIELDIPYELELSVLYVESGFDQNARNYNDTCRGMGQLSRTTGERVAKELHIENFWQKNVFNAKYNSDCSIYHLWELKQIGIERGYSDEENCLFILGAYNRGVSGYDRYVKTHGTMDTSYSNKVLMYKSQIEQCGEFK